LFFVSLCFTSSCLLFSPLLLSPGPWTTKPLRFDNEYFVNLLHRTWKLREWDGPLQFEDEESGTLMMLPSDIALTDDSIMRAMVVEYAEDQDLFFGDFALAYAKLLCLGCPEECNCDRLVSMQAARSSRDEKVGWIRLVGCAGMISPERANEK